MKPLLMHYFATVAKQYKVYVKIRSIVDGKSNTIGNSEESLGLDKNASHPSLSAIPAAHSDDLGPNNISRDSVNEKENRDSLIQKEPELPEKAIVFKAKRSIATGIMSNQTPQPFQAIQRPISGGTLPIKICY